MSEHVRIEHGLFIARAGRKPHTLVDVHLGRRPDEWVPNPALHPEDGGSWHERWARHVQIAVSPTGRAVSINVDGVNITPELVERLKAERRFESRHIATNAGAE